MAKKKQISQVGTERAYGGTGYETEAPPKPKVNPVRTIISGITRTIYPEVRPATKAEDETSKLRGQRAYYEGKIQRNRKK